jgi:tetratricopeptide (TPR) repeat protein
MVRAKLGDFLLANGDLEDAVKLAPANARMHFDYGQVCEERQNKFCDLNSALAQYRLARDLDPNESRYSSEFERLWRKLNH